MNSAIELINNHMRNYNAIPSILLSGTDLEVKSVIFRTWFNTAAEMRAPHIVLDLSVMCELANVISDCGARIGGYIPGNNCFAVFDGDEIDIEDRLRVLMSDAEWALYKQDTALTYLLFLAHIYKLETGKSEKFNLELITRYSSPKDFEYTIRNLLNRGIIDYKEQINILARYSELKSIAPDLENLLLGGAISLGMSSDADIKLESLNEQVLYVHLGKIHDEYTRKKILNGLRAKIENYIFNKSCMCRPIVTIYCKGKKTDSLVSGFVDEINEMGQVLLVSDNVYGISENGLLESGFPIRIYSRHNIMDAAQQVEKTLGNIYIKKKTYSRARDMHHKSRGIIDRILKTDIVLTESYLESQPEAKYRKEDIMMLPNGYCIVSYMGQDMYTRLT